MHVVASSWRPSLSLAFLLARGRRQELPLLGGLQPWLPVSLQGLGCSDLGCSDSGCRGLGAMVGGAVVGGAVVWDAALWAQHLGM